MAGNVGQQSLVTRRRHLNRARRLEDGSVVDRNRCATIHPAKGHINTAASTNCTAAASRRPWTSCPSPGMKKLQIAASTFALEPCPAMVRPCGCWSCLATSQSRGSCAVTDSSKAAVPAKARFAERPRAVFAHELAATFAGDSGRSSPSAWTTCRPLDRLKIGRRIAKPRLRPSIMASMIDIHELTKRF